MPNSFFTYNNKDCGQWNCFKTQPINWITPERDIERKPVPGRNGDLIIDNGRYNNIELTIECYIKGDFIRLYDSMRAYLMSDTEYHRFIDSLYPNEYRMVRVTNVESKVATRTGGTVEITLDAKPQRFWNDNNSYSYVSSVQPQTTYAYTDFSTASQAEITQVAKSVGYTDAEISAMKYTIFNASGVTVDVGDRVMFAGSGADPFFYISFMDNPRTAQSFSGAYGLERDVYKFNVSQVFDYIVRPYEYGSRFLVNGELQSTLWYTQDFIYNQTNYPAKPLIKLESINNAVEDYVGGIGDCGIYLSIPYSYGSAIRIITIDAETMDAYSLPTDNDLGTFINCNGYIRYTGDLEIKPGDNEVLTNDRTRGMTIVPRWWTL